MLQRRSKPVNGSVPDFSAPVVVGVLVLVLVDGSVPLLVVDVVGVVLVSFDGDVPVVGVFGDDVPVVGVFGGDVPVVGVFGVWL